VAPLERENTSPLINIQLPRNQAVGSQTPEKWNRTVETDTRQKNITTLEEILSRLDEAIRLCKSLDLSQLPGIDQSEWENRMKVSKDAIEFTKGSVERLQKILG